MATIQITRRDDGSFMRLERFYLPFRGCFSRRYVVVSGVEYELVGNFQCQFLSTLRRQDELSVHICVATDDGEGRLKTIEPEYLTQCGQTVCCQHVCQYKKYLAGKLLDCNCNRLSPGETRLIDMLNHVDTIELNPEVLAYGIEGPWRWKERGE